MLLNQQYSAFFYFGGKFILFVHGSILSKAGASSKSGAIQNKAHLTCALSPLPNKTTSSVQKTRMVKCALANVVGTIG